MPTQFELEDLRVSEDADRLHGEEIIWRPVAARVGGVYTQGDPRTAADPLRPERTLIGILSSAPSITSISGARTAQSTGSAVGNIAFTVDFSAQQFGFGAGPFPRKGDRFELPDQPPERRYLEVLRNGNATFARRSYHCMLTNGP